MSHIIVDFLIDYAEKGKPLMLIASRNQVDSDSGYVMTTSELRQKHWVKFSQNVILCRDHCGPYFLDAEKNLSEEQAIEATKKTIANDIENDFKLIHIDTSRCQDPYRAADKLFEFALKQNPDIWFEFGSEENIGTAAGVSQYMKDVKYASQYPNTKFVVAQTGSLTMEDRQVGTFETEVVKHLVEFAEQNNVQLKEHNADYLTAEQILLRKDTGVHACNIAPQLGVLQTKTVLKYADYYGISTADFKETVLNSKKWTKWMLSDNQDKKILVAGHYCFNHPTYLELEERLSKLFNLKLAIEERTAECLDLYYNCLY